MKSRKTARRSRHLGGRVGRYVEAAGYAFGKPPPKPPGKPPEPRDTLAFEARADGSLVIYVTPPDGAEHWWAGEPIRIEPQRVSAVLAACGDALAKKKSVR